MHYPMTSRQPTSGPHVMTAEVHSERSVDGKTLDVLSVITIIFFILTFAIKAFTDDLYAKGEISSTIAYSKYATAAICTLAAFLRMHTTGERIFVREFDELAVIGGLFTAETLILLAAHGQIEGYVFIELLKLIMPVFMAYGVVNALSPRQIKICMIAVFIICLPAYVLNLARNGVTFSSLASVDFATSGSPTEDAGFAGISLILALYFMYFRVNMVLTVLSVIFCILTFKRLSLVVCLAAIVISCFFPQLMAMRINRHFRTLCKVLTIAGVGVWYWLLLPQQENLFVRLFGQSPAQLTSGRSAIMNYLIESGFRSYGFGSANDVTKTTFNGTPFEMDLIKIAFELGPIMMMIFVWLFWDIAGDSFWGYFIVGYFMLNMITSDSLSSNFSFTLTYITIALVNVSQAEGDTEQGSGDKTSSNPRFLIAKARNAPPNPTTHPGLVNSKGMTRRYENEPSQSPAAVGGFDE